MEKDERTMKVSTPPAWVLWLGWIIWLPFLVPETIAFVRARPPLALLTVTLLLLASFVGAYAGAAWRTAGELTRAPGEDGEASRLRWLSAALLLALSVVVGFLSGSVNSETSSPFIYTSAFIAGAFRPVRAIQANAAVLVAALATGWILHVPDLGQTLFIICVVSFVTISWAHAVRTTYLLRAAQAEISQLAVASERLRIARDLHDLLGHRLSLVAIKSELARRLVSTAPDRASGEIADIEQAARSMLQDVREAVSRYRAPDLAGELRAAAELLSASGITLIRDGDDSVPGTLSPRLNETAAWAVREGVTNVVRHSRARTCTIRISREEQDIVLDIVDDGSPSSVGASTGARTGHGITGLTERAREIGGRCEAGPQDAGGFRLTVSLPQEKAT
jgi:two-component system sensor histidine kinase DesK